MERNPDTLLREIDRARNLYDTILIDCPPGLGAPTRAALLASDSFLVPLQAEELCRDSVDSLLEFVESFRTRTFPAPVASGDGPADPLPLTLEGIFLTMASDRTRMGRHVAARVSEDFGHLMFDTAVPRTTRLSEMALRGKPAVIYDRRSAGSRAYFDLADELVRRFMLAEEVMGLEPSLTDPPALIDPLGPESEDGPVHKLPKSPAPDSLEKFLAALGGSGNEGPAPVRDPETGDPEIVSLDDLLAEEENRNGPDQADDDWNGGFFNRDTDGGKRFN